MTLTIKNAIDSTSSASMNIVIPAMDVDETPSPCGTQLIYDESTCASGGGGEPGTGGGGNTDPVCWWLVTITRSDDGWLTSYVVLQYIEYRC